MKQRTYYNEKLGRVVTTEGRATRIAWSPMMLDYLRRNFATTINEELAEWLGVSHRTVTRKARELGLEKDPVWLKAVWNERREWARIAARRKGYPGCFKKGEHNNPAGEFKPGRVPTEDEKRKKVESMRRWHLRNRPQFREAMRKSWDTRRERYGASGMKRDAVKPEVKDDRI